MDQWIGGSVQESQVQDQGYPESTQLQLCEGTPELGCTVTVQCTVFLHQLIECTMADRDFMELQEQEGMYITDGSVEIVTGARRVDVIAGL